MRVAPTPNMRGTLTGAPSGVAGVFHTLRLMRQLVNAAKVDPALIQTAVSAIWNVPAKAQAAEASALFDFVRGHIRYTRDVYGVETLSDPRMTLQRRVGDCDDQATLLAALFESAGYATRFVVAGYNSADFQHVFTQVFIDGDWIDADPTEFDALGFSPPDPVSIYFERV